MFPQLPGHPADLQPFHLTLNCNPHAGPLDLLLGRATRPQGGVGVIQVDKSYLVTL